MGIVESALFARCLWHCNLPRLVEGSEHAHDLVEGLGRIVARGEAQPIEAEAVEGREVVTELG